MNVGIRIKTIRLLKKIEEAPNYAEQVGIEIIQKEKNFPNKLFRAEIMQNISSVGLLLRRDRKKNATVTSDSPAVVSKAKVISQSQFFDDRPWKTRKRYVVVKQKETTDKFLK